jgi:hypothetical protein
MQAVIYRRRRSAVSRSEREWRVEPEALVTRGATGRERRYAWKDVVSVRLRRQPAPTKPWRYVFEMQPRHARKIIIDNAHYLARGAFEDRSAAYTQFVRAALARLAATNPKARALIGETKKRYFLLLLAALLGLGLLAFGLVALRTPIDALPYAALLKFGAIVAMLPLFWLGVVKAMPRGTPLDSIPPRALPPEVALSSHGEAV